MVMFNNPIDKGQVMTLARQMYPESPQHLMRYFREATTEPYGYLLVDLKPTTPDFLRLRVNALNPESERLKGTEEDTRVANVIRGDDGRGNRINRMLPDQELPLPNDSEDMPRRDDRDLIFDDERNVRRHAKEWCPENTLKRTKDADDEEYGPPRKRWINTDDPFGNEEDEDQTFDAIMAKARSRNEEEWEKKLTKYVDGGLTEKEAECKAEDKMRLKDIDEFKNIYGTFVKHVLRLRDGPKHRAIMNAVKKFETAGYGRAKSIKMALSKNGHLFEDVWDETEDGSDENDDDDDDSSGDEKEYNGKRLKNAS